MVLQSLLSSEDPRLALSSLLFLRARTHRAISSPFKISATIPATTMIPIVRRAFSSEENVISSSGVSFSIIRA
jgi:hypothetical protein